MIVWLVVFGIVAVGIGVIVATGIREGQIDKDVALTANWLESKATIQSAAIERLDKYTWYPGFAFSYSVKGEYFSGKFFLMADRQQAEELVKSLLSQEFPVQYNPGNPSAWYIAEPTMAGFDILQELSHGYPSDTGPYRSDGDEPIDLHLGR